MNEYGIDEVIWKNIVTTCFNFPGVEKIILYGSRARGDHQHGSDIDLAIDAPSSINE
jgi:predicted nucleotidyltransferase